MAKKPEKTRQEAIELIARGDMNLNDICEKLDVSRDCLWRWRKEPDFQEAVIHRARELVRDALPGVYKALREKATEGNWRHIKMLLEHIERLEELKTTKGKIEFTWKND